MPWNKPRLALVLSGGGIRAAAQIGALRVFEEFGIFPDVIVGNSGGSIVGALYASGMTPDQMERIFVSYRNRSKKVIDINYGQIMHALFTLSPARLKGLIRGDRLLAEVQRQIGRNTGFADFEKPGSRKRPLLVIGVNLIDGGETVFASPSPFWAARAGEAGVQVCSRLSVAEAVRISSSIPGVFTPFVCERSDCPRNGAISSAYVDGGLRDNYAIATALRLAGATRILGVNLGYAGMRRESVLDGGIAEILSQTIDIFGQDQVEADMAYLEKSGARVVTINPLIYNVGTLDVTRIPGVISRGEAVTREMFSMIPGLKKGAENGAANLDLLFETRERSFVFPEPGSAAYRKWISADTGGEDTKKPLVPSNLRLPLILGLAAFCVAAVSVNPSHLPRFLLIAALAGSVALAWKTKRPTRSAKTTQR